MSLYKTAYLATANLEHSRNLSMFLAKLGFEVQSFSHSRSLLPKVRERKPDLLILDQDLETAGVGILVLQALRKVLDQKFTVFMMTQEKDLNAIRRLFEWGATEVLCGDYDRTALGQRISQHFQLSAVDEDSIKRKTLQRTQSTVALETVCKLISIDVSGVTLTSPHMLSRGAVIHLDAPILKEITGQERASLVSVQTCTWSRETEQHTCYATFDDFSNDTKQAIKNWLSSRV